MKTKLEWQKEHYALERDYAQKILKSEKNSPARSQLFKEGYDAITKLFQQYEPGGGETNYTDLVVSILAKSLAKNSIIFDLGCASGNLIKKLIDQGYQAEGIDVSQELIKQAKEKIGRPELVQQSDIFNYQADKKYDGIVLDNVIEHFHPDSINDILKKCHSMLKDGGIILILTPHRFSGPHDISQHFLPPGSKAQGFHLIEFSFGDLSDRLNQVGFSKIYGFPFHPRLFKSWVPGYSVWAGRKAELFEKVLQIKYLNRVLTINHNLSHFIISLSCPSICVARK